MVAVNTDVDAAQTAALDALAYFQSKHTGSIKDLAHLAYVKILTGQSVDLTPLQAAVTFREDSITVATVIEYIILSAVHEAAQIDRED